MGVDVRSFNSVRRSSCLKGMVLALILNAPISLKAQNGSSQSQPAQSASAPPPPAPKTQPENAPTASTAPPILKRGKQPDLPPWPDPPVAAPPPAGSTRT